MVKRSIIAQCKQFGRLVSTTTTTTTSTSPPGLELINMINTNKGYTIVQMNRPPVNSFNLQLMRELITAVDISETSSQTRGLIITSAHRSFGAGLDLHEMCNSDLSHLKLFWSAFQELHLRLYTSPLVTLAAINGHAVAGASALTLVCDYRIMAEGKYKIGLPTVHTGILVPLWLSKLFKLTVGEKEAQRYLCLGALSSPEEALSRGLVDSVVPGEELMDTCGDLMERWLKVPDNGRVRTKQLMRGAFVEEFKGDSERDRDEYLNMMSDPAFVEHLKSYTGRLKKK